MHPALSSTLSALLALGAATLVSPVVPDASAQTAQKVHRLAIFEVGTVESSRLSTAAFEKGLKDLGYVEGQNLVVDRRFADGQADRLPALAAELVRNRPDVIFAPTTPTAHAAKAASSQIPIVIAVASDPVASGFAASLGRPGSNVTGTSNIQTDVDPKRLQILKEALPRTKRIALLHAGDRLAQIQIAAAQKAGKSLGIEIVSMEAQKPEDFKKGFAAAKARGVDAMFIVANSQNSDNKSLIVNLAAEYRLPAIYPNFSSVLIGGMMSYGTDGALLYYRAAAFVDKILKGARPADLPIEQPTKFELFINLKTAKVLGITFPQSLLVRADQVIE